MSATCRAFISLTPLHCKAWSKEFYEQRHGRIVDRAMVISPMIDDRAYTLAKDLGIETHSYADGVKLSSHFTFPQKSPL